ncbi:sensor histidine kinase [Nonomuraea sp. NPDC059023]|uniref:sensor histidine kinase n=1 Tax=unclassified Nonomuraea TaxID=2593643 RepID=UPI00367F3D9D
MKVAARGEFGNGRSQVRAGSVAWLLVTLWPLWTFLSTGPALPRVLWAFGGLAVLSGCWMTIMWRMLGEHSGAPRRWPMAGLAAAALALLPVLGPPWAFVAFIYVITGLAATTGGAGFVAGVLLTIAVTMGFLLAHGLTVWWLVLVILAQAGAVHGMKQMGHLLVRLAAARAQVAQLAVDNERLRFSRDLHDTLGHTLTSITIRSQLAARLARTDPDRAAREMGDVEAAARQALDEVRHAVAGYRAPALSEELEKAARELELAGVEVVVSPAGGPIPGAAETLLAWAVREAATNVLRHSGARHCWITLSVDTTWAELEVRDNGPTTAPPATLSDRPPATAGPLDGAARRGNGLTGLAERVAGAGGSLDVGALPEGGYRLCARVPLEAA